MNKIIYLEQDEEIISVIDKINSISDFGPIFALKSFPDSMFAKKNNLISCDI